MNAFCIFDAMRCLWTGWLLLLPSSQSDQSDFRRTVESHGKIDRPQARIGVKHQGIDVISTQVILLRQRRQEKRRPERNPDLASMGVSGKLQVNGVSGDDIGKIGLVHKQNHGFAVWNGAQCLRHVGIAAENVVQAGKPKTSTIAFHRQRFIR